MTESQPAGPIVDGLGVTYDLDPGDLVASALVISKIVGDDGEVSVHIAGSDGMSWLDRMGLLAAAQNITQQAPFETRDED